MSLHPIEEGSSSRGSISADLSSNTDRGTGADGLNTQMESSSPGNPKSLNGNDPVAKLRTVATTAALGSPRGLPLDSTPSRWNLTPSLSENPAFSEGMPAALTARSTPFSSMLFRKLSTPLSKRGMEGSAFANSGTTAAVEHEQASAVTSIGILFAFSNLLVVLILLLSWSIWRLAEIYALSLVWAVIVAVALRSTRMSLSAAFEASIDKYQFFPWLWVGLCRVWSWLFFSVNGWWAQPTLFVLQGLHVAVLSINDALKPIQDGDVGCTSQGKPSIPSATSPGLSYAAAASTGNSGRLQPPSSNIIREVPTTQQSTSRKSRRLSYSSAVPSASSYAHGRDRHVQQPCLSPKSSTSKSKTSVSSMILQWLCSFWLSWQIINLMSLLVPIILLFGQLFLIGVQYTVLLLQRSSQPQSLLQSSQTLPDGKVSRASARSSALQRKAQSSRASGGVSTTKKRKRGDLLVDDTPQAYASSAEIIHRTHKQTDNWLRLKLKAYSEHLMTMLVLGGAVFAMVFISLAIGKELIHEALWLGQTVPASLPTQDSQGLRDAAMHMGHQWSESLLSRIVPSLQDAGIDLKDFVSVPISASDAHGTDASVKGNITRSLSSMSLRDLRRMVAAVEHQLPEPMKGMGQAMLDAVTGQGDGFNSKVASRAWKSLTWQNLMAVLNVARHPGAVVATFVTSILNLLVKTSTFTWDVLVSAQVFATATWYLTCSNSSPIEYIHKALPLDDGVRKELESMISNVFSATIQSALLNFLGTWGSFLACGCNLTVLPATLSGLVAVVRLIEPSMLGCLMSVAASFFMADVSVGVILCSTQVLLFFVDGDIFSNLASFSHPYVMGLAVVSGAYVYGISGVLFGPLLVSAVGVFYNAAVRGTDTLSSVLNNVRGMAASAVPSTALAGESPALSPADGFTFNRGEYSNISQSKGPRSDM